MFYYRVWLIINQALLANPSRKSSLFLVSPSRQRKQSSVCTQTFWVWSRRQILRKKKEKPAQKWEWRTLARWTGFEGAEFWAAPREAGTQTGARKRLPSPRAEWRVTRAVLSPTWRRELHRRGEAGSHSCCWEEKGRLAQRRSEGRKRQKSGPGSAT